LRYIPPDGEGDGDGDPVDGDGDGDGLIDGGACAM